MKSLLREFDEQAQKAIVVAESLSFDFGHQNVGSEHLLLSLLKIHDNQLKRLLQKYDVNDAAVEEDIKRLFGTNDDQPFYMEYSQSVKRILERSIEYAKDKNQDQVTLNILIISLLKEKESVAYEILQKYHVDVEEVIYLLQEKSAFETPLDQIPTLVNINKKVKTKKYKIIGRENEIDQVCTILSKKEKNNVLIIEDDYNGELRYSTHPMPCVQNYDTENTVYLGSFSKILLPSVRISYMVLPQKLTDEYNKIKKYTNQTASKTEQIALAKYINNGKLDVHLRKARRIYLEKSNLMLSNIKKYFGTSVKIVFNETSLYVSLIFKDKTIDDSVIKKIDNALIKTMQFNKTENMIVLSFSGIKDVKSESGIKLLYETISKYDPKCGKTPVEYYDEKLPPILDQFIRNIFEVRNITSDLQKNISWEKVMVEKIVNSVNGQGKFDEFTKNDIDDVIKMFQELQTKVEG